MWRRDESQSRTSRGARRAILSVFGVGMLCVMLAVSGCGSDPSLPQATRAKSALDAELRHAQQMGIPANLTQPILAAERKAAQGAGSWGYSYQNAEPQDAKLHTQLLQVEQQSQPELMQQATRNLGLFSTLVAARKADGFVEADGYEQRLHAAQQALQSAQTPDDIARVAQEAHDQVQALEALVPTYQQMQAFQGALGAVTKVGIGAAWAATAYQDDLTAFRAANI